MIIAPMADEEKPTLWRRPPAIGLYMGLVLGLFEIIPMVSEGGVGSGTWPPSSGTGWRWGS